VSAVRTTPILLPDAGGTWLSDRLRKRLLALDYPDFARCVCRLLEALGYEDARPAGRDEWKGYNRPGGGGWDLEASLPGGIAPRRVVAQIKQYDGLRVHQRSVDELRGACLRAGASEGLLVTTSGFSEVVRRAALSPAPTGPMVAPVRLIGAEELLALMIRHRIGVRRRGLYKRGLIGKRRSDTDRLDDSLEIDEVFFASTATPKMEQMHRHRRPTLPGLTLPGLRVSIQILSRPCPGEKPKGEKPKGGHGLKGGR
jgi:hypothetical protein